MSLIVLYLLHSTWVLSYYRDVVLILSIVIVEHIKEKLSFVSITNVQVYDAYK